MKKKKRMGSSTFSKHDLEMIEISWAFVKDKQSLSLNTMIRIFESSNEIKEMFGFLSSLDNKMSKIQCHSNKVIDTLDKIVILLTNSALFSEQEKNELVNLGKRHYHFGLKFAHFKVFSSIIIYIIF